MTKTIFYIRNVSDNYLSNCVVRCVSKKSFLSSPYFSMITKKKYAKSKQICRKFAKLCPPSPTSSTEFPPLYMCGNIQHFGITKRKVMTSKLQVTPTKLQVTRSKFTSLTADTNTFQLTNMVFITF